MIEDQDEVSLLKSRHRDTDRILRRKRNGGLKGGDGVVRQSPDRAAGEARDVRAGQDAALGEELAQR